MFREEDHCTNRAPHESALCSSGNDKVSTASTAVNTARSRNDASKSGKTRNLHRGQLKPQRTKTAKSKTLQPELSHTNRGKVCAVMIRSSKE